MDGRDPARAEWQRIYHDHRWSSLLIDVLDFAVACLAGVLGLVTIFFTVTSLGGAARTQSVNVRVCTMTCGSKSWSMPYLDGNVFLHMVEPGMMVRVRYRPGSWSIADLWILREVAAGDAVWM